ncbi:protein MICRORCHIDIA 6-like [Phragmites australis]|uniref:protein MICRORCHIDIA 6-like n=1 Tax=Phragmites australis TaxID=29695 RepID=UPI002D781408|nr:protein MICRORCHIDIA 6-like [Phragmites australis]
MDTQRDTKPFFSPITAAAIQRGIHGPNTCQAAAPLERGGARGAAWVQPQAACVLNRAASELSGGCGDRSSADGAHEGTSVSHPFSSPRISRKFWSAGEYEAAARSSARQPQGVQNRMCVHPKFLHSNATSHKWPFGAVAELLDNAVDEIQTGGTTRIIVDKVINNRNGPPALLVQDDGGGMDPDSLRRCMSFGFSDKQSGCSIGQYGNGFKTSTMRLGADVIVFSRCTKSGELTQSIGLLSYTFLAETGQKDVVVPVVDYKCNLFTGQTKRIERHGSDQFASNLSVFFKWSPFATEEELMQNFSDIGPHGTKIIVFNLWSNDDGDLELDFDTNPEDIMISGAPNPAETNNSVRRTNENHLANRLRYSLRVYTSVLYLQLPEYFKIILRGQEVKRHCIAADLIYPECISYKPQVCGRKEAEVFTSIGFLDGTPIISVHGFNIYHKNRLIMPFHRVLSSASSKGRGVAGVLEADFIKPTHDKQDFEKSQLYQRLINRLKDMTNEYWDTHCHKAGYVKTPRARAAQISPAPPVVLPPANTVAEPLEGNAPAPSISVAPSSSTCANAVPIAFAPLTFCSTPAGTGPIAPGAPAGPSSSGMQIMQVNQMSSPSMALGTDLVETRKRKNDDAVLTASFKRQVTHEFAGSSSVESSDQICQYMGERELKEFSFLKLENRMLRDECKQFEMAERELLFKEHKLRLEIEQAQAQYKSLLNEYVVCCDDT